MTFIIDVAYLVGFWFTGRLVFNAVINLAKKDFGEVEGIDYVVAGIAGFFAGATWPLVLIVVALVHTWKQTEKEDVT